MNDTPHSPSALALTIDASRMQNEVIEHLHRAVVRLDEEIAGLKAQIEEIRRNGTGSGVTG